METVNVSRGMYLDKSRISRTDFHQHEFHLMLILPIWWSLANLGILQHFSCTAGFDRVDYNGKT